MADDLWFRDKQDSIMFEADGQAQSQPALSPWGMRPEAQQSLALDHSAAPRARVGDIGVSPADLRRYREMFTMFDTNGSGTITCPELANILPRIGIFLSDEELMRLMQNLDFEDCGDLTYDEFVGIVARHRRMANLLLMHDDRDSFFSLHRNLRLTGLRLWPDGWFRIAWDVVISQVIIFYTVVVPLAQMGFLGEHCDIRDVPPYLCWMAALAFLTDVGVRSVSSSVPGYTEPAILFTQSWGVLLHKHVRSPGFIVDVIAGVPLDLVLWAAGAHRAALQLQWLRVAKLLRWSSFFPIAARTLVTPGYTILHYQVLPMYCLLFWMLVAVHVLALLWIAASQQTEQDKIYTDDAKGLNSYLTAVYVVLQSLSTVGYGDQVVSLRGDEPWQRIVSMVMFLFSFLVTGMVVAKLVKIYDQVDLSSDLEKKMAETVAVLRHLEVPPNFQQEILAFQHYQLATSHQVFTDTLQLLPQAILDRMELYARMKMVQHVPVLSRCPRACITMLAQSLECLTVPPDEHIVVAGETAADMFFLAHGMCSVVLHNGRWVAWVRRGGVFGELGLAGGRHTRRASGVKSLTYCQLFKLATSNVADVATHFPELEALLDKQRSEDERQETTALARVDSSMCGSGTGEWEETHPLTIRELGAASELSSYWPCRFVARGKGWPSTEHYYQAAKFPASQVFADEIRSQPTPEAARRLGSEHRAGRALHPEWDKVREEVMCDAMRYKFAQDRRCRKVLLATQQRSLRFETACDGYWGIVASTGEGQNRFGLLLEKVRLELRHGELQNYTGEDDVPASALTHGETIDHNAVLSPRAAAKEFAKIQEAPILLAVESASPPADAVSADHGSDPRPLSRAMHGSSSVEVTKPLSPCPRSTSARPAAELPAASGHTSSFGALPGYAGSPAPAQSVPKSRQAQAPPAANGKEYKAVPQETASSLASPSPDPLASTLPAQQQQQQSGSPGDSAERRAASDPTGDPTAEGRAPSNPFSAASRVTAPIGAMQVQGAGGPGAQPAAPGCSDDGSDAIATAECAVLGGPACQPGPGMMPVSVPSQNLPVFSPGGSQRDPSDASRPARSTRAKSPTQGGTGGDTSLPLSHRATFNRSSRIPHVDSRQLDARIPHADSRSFVPMSRPCSAAPANCLGIAERTGARERTRQPLSARHLAGAPDGAAGGWWGRGGQWGTAVDELRRVFARARAAGASEMDLDAAVSAARWGAAPATVQWPMSRESTTDTVLQSVSTEGRGAAAAQDIIRVAGSTTTQSGEQVGRANTNEREARRGSVTRSSSG